MNLRFTFFYIQGNNTNLITSEWLQQHLSDRISIVQPIFQDCKLRLRKLRILTACHGRTEEMKANYKMNCTAL